MPNMPKRGRDRGKHNNYYEHDDRDFTGDGSKKITRRVLFKDSRRSGRSKNPDNWKIRQAFLLDGDDVDMNNAGGRNVSGTRVTYSTGRQGYFHSRGSRHRDSPVPASRRILQEAPFGWYKVFIPYGNKYEKDYLINVLNSYMRVYASAFVPYGFRATNDDVSFFVDDFAIAEQLLNADRKIITKDGIKLKLCVRCNPPYIELDDKLKQKIKEVMSRRYNLATQALDLRQFHADQEFLAENIFVPINRPNVMVNVVQVITQSIPEIRAIDLSDNKLMTLEFLKPMAEKTRFLKVLHIAQNLIKHTAQLDGLQGLPIEDLNIDGNPVCDRFKDKSTYIREIRRRFPKVIKLDSVDLPPPIGFDVEENSTLIPSLGGFLCDVNGGNVVRQFLEQYYTIFDSDSRQPLIEAYHEEAQFSMTSRTGLPSYIQDSRNILLVQGLEKRIRLLKQGKGNIISYLNSFVKTQHDPSSFAVDLLLFTPQLIQLCVTGVYREPSSGKLPIRAFNRVFVIVPVGSGFCIINDMLSCTVATPEQAKEAFKVQTVTTPQPPVVASPIATPPATLPIISPPGSIVIGSTTSVETQQQMVATLALQTGMNLAWSEKCLNETNWNFENAHFVFSELNKQGKVPAEAFVK